MKQKEVREALRCAVHAGLEQWLTQETNNEHIKLGGVVLSAPNRLKIRLVDADYKPHTYNVLIEEATR